MYWFLYGLTNCPDRSRAQINNKNFGRMFNDIAQVKPNHFSFVFIKSFFVVLGFTLYVLYSLLSYIGDIDFLFFDIVG